MMSDSYEEIFKNNRRWIESKLKENKDFFKELAENQNPEFLYIGCSDSRVTAEELMGVKPGQVFVHRNIANVVNAIDMNVASVIQYAVEHLRVKHIVICGHYSLWRGKISDDSARFWGLFKIPFGLEIFVMCIVCIKMSSMPLKMKTSVMTDWWS
ncbi:hypothetical protein CCAN11_1100002 [Capnocytophaga canimorsus]|uniref:carbonic anhydrase n=1 Tax=Capnocytophaga canimorsus TaxID=28188 RepID=A0A0B7I6X9_9FLAO|nr:hypothetical protein CCAN11_1100002 [Capnocytophaga canimorsus]